MLIASCWFVSFSISANSYRLNQDGINDIPDSAHLQPEPLSAYGNPSTYQIHGKHYHVLASAANYDKIGTASWYGKEFHGRLTANREVYDMYQYSAASKTLPIPSYVRVTNLANGKSLVVRVNDRGPYKSGRLIDLSYGAAQKLGFVQQGITQVRVTTLHSEQVPHASHYLRMASFANYHNAEHFQAQLAQLTDDDIRIETTTNAQHRTLYRVEVGPFDNRDDCQEAKQFFQEQGYSHTFAVLG